jgi:sugar phosphate isomerase/epimerase
MRKLSRKDFLRMTAASSMALPLLGYGCMGRAGKAGEGSGTDAGKATGDLASGGTFYDEVGFQVFTLRDLLVDNAPTLFKGLAGAGIRNIEFYDPRTLNRYVPIVKEYGMIPLATHFQSGYVTGIWEPGQEPGDGYGFDNVLEDCVNNGIHYLGVAILTRSEQEALDSFKSFAEKANVCGEKAKAAGVQLYYHNHNFEFRPMGGTTPYQAMLNIFDKDLVKLELDVFWNTVAGQDPVEWINRIAPWMLFLHLKDLKKGATIPVYTTSIPVDSFIELGEGMINLEGILKAGRDAGLKYAIIDQDVTQMEDKIASVKKNTAYIRELGI